MSIADSEIDDPCCECETCGEWCDRRLCQDCQADVQDEYAEIHDAQYRR